MAIDSNLIKLAVDGYKGHVAGDYSVGDTQEALRNALVEANGGSTKLDLIEHVEASTGEKATIIGTKKALRKIKTANMSDSAKEQAYAMGYIGALAGTPLVAVAQRHAYGTDDFILDDNTIYVFAGDTKPIKRVTEGDVTMLMGNPMDNADMTQEFLMMKRTGIAVIFDRDFGVYKLS